MRSPGNSAEPQPYCGECRPIQNLRTGHILSLACARIQRIHIPQWPRHNGGRDALNRATWLVDESSMGCSFWQLRHRQKALELTYGVLQETILPVATSLARVAAYITMVRLFQPAIDV